MRTSALWPALLIWLVTAGAIVALDGWWNLGNLALLLVLGSTLASFWLSATASMLASALAVALFNWFLVPPRYTLHVQLHQDLLLLTTLLGTSTLISVLTSRLRQHAQTQAEQARHAERLQQLASRLQNASSVAEQVQLARDLLQNWTGLPVTLWLGKEAPETTHPLHRAWLASQQEQGAIGPGTGRHDELSVRVLPLRAGVMRIGTLALGPDDSHASSHWPLDRLQTLVRLVADEVQRLQSGLQARQDQDHLQAQQLRNTLLAAISHDYRTPLATITGAASSLQDNHDPARVQTAARTILDEAEHLHRMTSNTLQMARLDTLDAPLQTSWESVEELCGAVLAGARRRHPGRHIETHVPAGLPLLGCDPVLVVQLLDNLIENALRYSPSNQPVALCAHGNSGAVQFEVLDRGIGIPPEWHNKVFDPFRRVLPETRGDTGFAEATRRGMGLGLALCQAIARAHHAHLWIEDREGGGTRVCLRFHEQSQPAFKPEET
jgi:two-component system, OmpR family, sensor histidine kinase KdpD